MFRKISNLCSDLPGNHLKCFGNKYIMLTKAAFIWSKIQQNCEIGLLFQITVFYFKMQFIPLMQIWIFCIITPVFSVTWSFRNYSNMLICCSLNFFVLLSMLKTVLLLYIFVEIVLYFLQDSMMNRKSKRTVFICNIIIAFYCHFWSILMHPCLIKVYISFCSSPHSLLCEHDCPIWHVSPSVRNVVISPRILQLANPKTNHPNFTSNRQVWIYRSNIAFKPRTGA